MKKTVKILTAIMLVAVLCMGLTGCHEKGAIAVTVDGEDFTAGFYSCTMVTADSDAMSLMAAETGITSEDNSSFLKGKIGDTLYTDWVKNRTLEMLKEFVATKRLCEENAVNTAETLETIKQNAALLWSQGYSLYYENNGVSEDTFKSFNAYNSYRSLYFNHLYGEGGKEAISAEDIEKHLNEKYAYINSLSISLTDLDEEEITEYKEMFNGYADRLNKGENFEKIYAEASGSASDEDKKEEEKAESAFSHSYAEIWSDEGTEYESEYYSLSKSVNENEAKVLEHTDSDNNKVLVLILKGKIFDDKNTNLETMKTAARYDIKGEAFDKLITDKAAALNVIEHKNITKQFKVEKIYFPEV